jgi:hypothetical protein
MVWRNSVEVAHRERQDLFERDDMKRAALYPQIGSVSGCAINSLLKKASEHAIANAIKNSSSPKANKKRDSMSQRTSKSRPERVFQQTVNQELRVRHNN